MQTCGSRAADGSRPHWGPVTDHADHFNFDVLRHGASDNCRSGVIYDAAAFVRKHWEKK
jgi:hypothetical protein